MWLRARAASALCCSVLSIRVHADAGRRLRADLSNTDPQCTERAALEFGSAHKPTSKGFWGADIKIQGPKVALKHCCNQGTAPKQGSGPRGHAQHDKCCNASAVLMPWLQRCCKASIPPRAALTPLHSELGHSEGFPAHVKPHTPLPKPSSGQAFLM